MTRIERIASYIEDTDLIADIGCDQAILSIFLAKKGIHSIACDLRKNIIESALNKITKLGLSNLIDLRVSDGLEKIKENEVDTLVLSGMGTHTILNILTRSNMNFKKIITISNNKHDFLRIEMEKLGYKISCEEIIFDKKKYYNLIVFIPGKSKYTKTDIIIGKNHKNKKLLIEYNNYLLDKYKNIAYKSKKTSEIFEILSNYNINN